MSAAVDALVLIFALIVGVWIVCFGATGAVIARNAGLGRVAGFSAGVLLGPAGLLWLWWRGRRGVTTARRVDDAPRAESDAIVM